MRGSVIFLVAKGFRNILVLNERRNRISPDDSTRFLLELEQLSIDMDSPRKGPGHGPVAKVQSLRLRCRYLRWPCGARSVVYSR